jgi:hypothetical protein
MRPSCSVNLVRFLPALIPLTLISTGAVRAGSTGVLHETFGNGGVSAINLANPSQSLGNLNISATNIVAGGGMVYFELNVFHTNGAAPTGMALDATAGILYETFGNNGISAISLANPAVSLGNLGVSATNIVAGDGMVYFESGDTIYSTTSDLVGLNVVHTNGAPATGLALDATAAAVPEPSALFLMACGLLAIGGFIASPYRRRRRTQRPS